MKAARMFKVTIGENPPDRLDKALIAYLPEGEAISRTRLTSLIRRGAASSGDGVETDPVPPPEAWRHLANCNS